MRTPVESLLAAQAILKRFHPSSPEHAKVLNELRATIPAPLLAHFLRLIEQGRNGVSIVRHGVCSGCHLRLSSSAAAMMLKESDVHVCENCGSYLLLAPEELHQRVTPQAIAVRRKAGRPRAVLV